MSTIHYYKEVAEREFEENPVLLKDSILTEVELLDGLAKEKYLYVRDDGNPSNGLIVDLKGNSVAVTFGDRSGMHYRPCAGFSIPKQTISTSKVSWSKWVWDKRDPWHILNLVLLGVYLASMTLMLFTANVWYALGTIPLMAWTGIVDSVEHANKKQENGG